MDLLDILLARKLSLEGFENEGGTGGSSSLPSGGKEGSLLAKGKYGPAWTELKDLPIITEEKSKNLPSNNIMDEEGSFNLIIDEQPLADIIMTKKNGLYTCLIKEDGEELQGLCHITSEGNCWALVFDKEGKCYSQIVISGTSLGWLRLGAVLE